MKKLTNGFALPSGFALWQTERTSAKDIDTTADSNLLDSDSLLIA